MVPAVVSKTSLRLFAERVVHWIWGLVGWKRYGLAVVLGALAATSFAPFYNFLGLAIGFSGLVFLLDGAHRAQAPRKVSFFVGWAFGFGYFIVGMYWLAFAFMVQAEQFGWMIPIAVPGFMAFLGLFFAIPASFVAKWWSDHWSRVLLLALALSVFEFARGHVLTGLPWNLAGQALAGSALTAQVSAWVGPYGLSLIVLLMTLLPAASFSSGGVSGRPILAAACLGVAVLLFGAIRMAVATVGPAPDVQLAVMQPNVPQRDKLDPRKLDQHFRQLITDTQSALPDTGTAFALWPENAYPFLAQAENAPRQFASLFPHDAVLISGTYRSYADSDAQRYANSAVVFGQTVGAEKPILAVYDKHHLVPFGEYLPMKALLKALRLSQLAPTADGFTPGPGPQTLEVAGTRFAPIICFETIFPLGLYPRGDRPDWLAVVTNDAWFGDSAGPQQHLDISRLRAIESGLPLVRSANTGISAVIDPLGRLIASVPLYENGSIQTFLPGAAGRTLYDRWGNWLYLLSGVVIAGVFIRLRVAMPG